MSDQQSFVAELSESLLWDVDPETLDADKHAAFLITRVMERGSREEVRKAWQHYGESKVKKCLLNAPSLSSKTISFFANQFRVSQESFRSYQQQSNWQQ